MPAVQVASAPLTERRSRWPSNARGLRDGAVRDSMADPRGSLMFRSAFTLTLFNSLWFIWSNRFLPISDYPDWVFQGTIMARMLRGAAVPHYSIKLYPIPYSTIVTLLGLLDLIFPAEVSGKIVLSLTVVLFAVSSTYLLKALNRSEGNPLLYVPLVFILNCWFFWGELFYLLGTGLLFLYLGYLLRRLESLESISGWSLAVVSCALFFSHLLPYLTALLVSAIVVLPRSDVKLARKFLLAFVPSVALTVWYALARFLTEPLAQHVLWIPWTSHLIAGRFLAAFSPFPEFLPWLGSQLVVTKIAAVANLAICVAFALLWPACAFIWIRGGRQRSVVLLAALGCLAAVFAGGYSFAGMVSPGERFLYPAGWLALCWLAANWGALENFRIAKALTALIFALVVAQGAYLDVYGAMVSDRLQSLYAQLRAAKTQAEFCAIYDDSVSRSWDVPHRRGLDRFLTNHASAPRLPYYMFIEDRVTAPIFQIGVLSYDGPGSGESLCGPDAAWQILPRLN